MLCQEEAEGIELALQPAIACLARATTMRSILSSFILTAS